MRLEYFKTQNATNKQTNICCPTQQFNVTPLNATCFSSHEPSSGTYFYNNFKNADVNVQALDLYDFEVQ